MNTNKQTQIKRNLLQSLRSAQTREAAGRLLLSYLLSDRHFVDGLCCCDFTSCVKEIRHRTCLHISLTRHGPCDLGVNISTVQCSVKSSNNFYSKLFVRGGKQSFDGFTLNKETAFKTADPWIVAWNPSPVHLCRSENMEMFVVLLTCFLLLGKFFAF